MPARFVRTFLMIVLCSGLSACRTTVPAPVTGTGAREVVAKYFEALALQEWDLAYAQLHIDTQKRLNRAAFERGARAYRNKIGFPLGKVTVRSCDEEGDKAVARVILSDVSGSMKHRYHEGAFLHQSANGWGLVLPGDFGQP